MKDIRPYICRKLKEMRETQQPVWVSFKTKRYKIVPFDPWTDPWPEWNQGCFLVKYQGKYHVSWVLERQGRAWVNQRFYISLRNILARIEETHDAKQEM